MQRHPDNMIRKNQVMIRQYAEGYREKGLGWQSSAGTATAILGSSNGPGVEHFEELLLQDRHMLHCLSPCRLAMFNFIFVARAL